MKLTISFIGKQKRYRRSISVRTLVSFTVLSSLLMLVSSRSTDSVSEDIARIKLAQAANEAENVEISELAESTRLQLQVLAARLAEMDATVTQLDEQGKLIAAEFGMKAEDLEAFNPDSTPINVDNDPLLNQIATLQQSVTAKKQQLAMLESLVRGHHIHEQSQLSGRPIQSGWLSSYYGMRKDPFTGSPAMHKGLDFAGKTGDDVVSTAAGIITWAGERHGYGLLVEIDHGDGIVTRYGHNNALSVSVGDVVTKGQPIAIMGSTGRSTGAHVHYEVIRHGQQIDPLPYVTKRR
ncbi:peptidoglycan DD-metalloendopeptidase family protein [Alteromonas confluentis]|uniref:Peptidase M23 n=1 Tax=Alteromonas confluentis TaxID=1656094 RepID=A0A1E7ZCU4_9ALTE|nr:peptidoglycan DD-metalloendopeptidase family protein [Alteromonas confluentis]OFC71329.1 peptidase M23 [Alteromonas confluentis]